jgi:hypothetical protein
MGKSDVIVPLDEVKRGGLSTCTLRRGEMMQRGAEGECGVAAVAR